MRRKFDIHINDNDNDNGTEEERENETNQSGEFREEPISSGAMEKKWAELMGQHSELAKQQERTGTSADEAAETQRIPGQHQVGDKRRQAAGKPIGMKRRRTARMSTTNTASHLRRVQVRQEEDSGRSSASTSPQPQLQLQLQPAQTNLMDANETQPANTCAACLKPIRERYLLEALDKQWHEDCLKCACCDCRLGEVGSSLFYHSDKIFCRTDFLRIFGQHGHCTACKRQIPPFELVMRANENAYHMDCFKCQQCQYRFCVGDRFHLADSQRIVCLLCHAELAPTAEQRPQQPHPPHPPHPPQQQQVAAKTRAVAPSATEQPEPEPAEAAEEPARPQQRQQTGFVAT